MQTLKRDGYMNKYKNLKNEVNNSFLGIEKELNQMQGLSKQSMRASEAAKNAPTTINDIDKQFAKVTKLSKTDISFLLLATALQCVRQYVLTTANFADRPNDKDTAKEWKAKEQKIFEDKFGIDSKEKMDRSRRYYNPSLEEIVMNPVPYDASDRSPRFKVNLGGGDHRYKTLGHDPVLGWIFGTANIATSTLTTWDFRSYHIRTMTTGNHKFSRDAFSNNAQTGLVIEKMASKITSDTEIVAAALIKQYLHIKSDELSTKGLLLPFLTVTPDLGKKLASYGLDFANVKAVGKQATYAMLINMIIAMIHRLLYNEATDISEDLYEARTRKILMYSNLMASSSNVIYVAISKDLNKFDIGGLAVTLYRMISDVQFISKVKKEFLEKEFYNRVMEDIYDV